MPKPPRPPPPPHSRPRKAPHLAGPPRAPVAIGIGLLVGALAFGAICFRYIENYTWNEALYMSVITVSTVGFTEVRPLDDRGRIVAMILILVGVGAFTYVVSAISNYVLSTRIHGLFHHMQMERSLQQLAHHFIVCGYGRMGTQVAEQFRRAGRTVVVVERDAGAVEAARADGHIAVDGDAGQDDVLRRAGVERAAGLISTLDSDADALFAVLSARQLNPKIFVVARVNEQTSEPKLLKAGANRVMWPYGVNGKRMAQLAMKPNVVDFMEVLLDETGEAVVMEEMRVAPGSDADGRSLRDLDVRKAFGVSIAAIRVGGARCVAAPGGDTVLKAGDVIVAVGPMAALERLTAFVGTSIGAISGGNGRPSERV